MLGPLSPVKQAASVRLVRSWSHRGWISAFPQSFLKQTGNVLEQEPSEWVFEESFVEEMGLAFPE